MKEKSLITAILVLLAMHLLYVNAELLIKLLEVKGGFWAYGSKILFALSYSLITVLIIEVYPKPILFVTSALLDGFAVFLNYSGINDFVFLASVYLSIYTALVAISIGLILYSRFYSNEKTKTKRNGTKTKGKANETKQKGNEFDLNKIEQYEVSFLNERKRSLQNSINRIKDETKKEQKTKELNLINKALRQKELKTVINS